jgi:hypothetical protein
MALRGDHQLQPRPVPRLAGPSRVSDFASKRSRAPARLPRAATRPYHPPGRGSGQRPNGSLDTRCDRCISRRQPRIQTGRSKGTGGSIGRRLVRTEGICEEILSRSIGRAAFQLGSALARLHLWLVPTAESDQSSKNCRPTRRRRWRSQQHFSGTRGASTTGL